MHNQSGYKRFVHMSRALLVVFTIFLIPLLLATQVEGMDYYDYFVGDGCNPNTSYGDPVLPDGLPGWALDKNGFINFIYNDAPSTSKNYIIRTMLGEPSGTYWSGSGLSESEINDWVSRINNNDVTLDVEDYSLSTNTMRCQGADNIVVYQDDPYTWMSSLVFRYKGNISYVVKLDCGNPLGNLGGLPQASYSLTPTIRLSDSVIETGTSLNIYSSVNNGGPANSSGTHWWVSKTVDGSPRSNVVESYRDFSVGSNTNFDIRKDTDEDPVGAKVCYTLHVQPRSTSDGGEANSTACVTIGKKPKVQVTGGDLRTRGGTNTSISNLSRNALTDQTTYGSWVEYGIMAGGSVKNTSSGGALYSGIPSVLIKNSCSYSNLTFNNAQGTYDSSCGNGNYLGQYSNGDMPDIKANFANGTALAAGSITPSALSSGVYQVNGNLTLNASTLNSGQSVILKVDGDVTIAGDQHYPDISYSSVDQIPQLVIIANNIVINDSVTNIDSWLIANNSDKSGTIKTCSDYSTNWTINSCKSKLTVNGPVVTDKLYLYRTANADLNSPADSAETFNLRADAYMWAYNYSSKSSRIQTVYSTEVSPRF